MFFLSFQGSGLVTSSAAGFGGRRPLPVPPSAGQGLPHPQLRKWHRPPTSHSEETPGRPRGEAAKQRASEPLLFTHLSLARASMKIWCIFKSYTAIKWRENAPASVIPSPQGRTGISELIQTKLEPSLHFESRCSGIQLLVVDEPYRLACVAHNILGETPSNLQCTCFFCKCWYTRKKIFLRQVRFSRS